MPTAEEQRWFLQFADAEGRPWADETSIAARARPAVQLNPWDTGCQVTSFVGGYAAMAAMCETLETVITQAQGFGSFGQRGQVYLADWRFNPMRDVSPNNLPAQPGQGSDPTIMGYILRLMQAGVRVRALFWLPTFVGAVVGFTSHVEEHFWAAEIVKRENDRLMAKHSGQTSPIGIVALDLRMPELTVPSASHHQKMMVVRSGAINRAFCGGVDLAYTRRDGPDNNHPFLPASPRFLGGDWQSGTAMPEPTKTWSRRPDVEYASVDAAPPAEVKPPSDLPEVFGEGWQIWHDQHLQLEGPIVATLEAQFAERWRDQGRTFALEDWYSRQNFSGDQVIFSTPQAFDAATSSILPLELPRPVAAQGQSRVQMWRTIPLRARRERGPFLRGEFTVMAGIAKACKAANELIWIFDQYFWSRGLARLLNHQIKQKPSLHLIVTLPPHADTQPLYAHHARRCAIADLLDGLTLGSGLERVGVYDLWHPQQQRGIYCHAKVQIYDGSLLVCGSANLNRRSFMCDSELACAVLDPTLVQGHQQQLWELLFADVPGAPWPNLNLNNPGSGKAFFTAFIRAAAPPGTGAFLIHDPWVPGSPHQLPTPTPTPLEEDPHPLTFLSAYYLILDPSSLRHEPPWLRLDKWVERIESPALRKHWRRP